MFTKRASLNPIASEVLCAGPEVIRKEDQYDNDQVPQRRKKSKEMKGKKRLQVSVLLKIS